ncbi:unnamed protein product [Absidia cylindrospora]
MDAKTKSRSEAKLDLSCHYSAGMCGNKADISLTSCHETDFLNLDELNYKQLHSDSLKLLPTKTVCDGLFPDTVISTRMQHDLGSI